MIYLSTLLTALAVLFMIKPEIITNTIENLQEYPVAIRCLFAVLTFLLLIQVIVIFV